MYLVPAHPSVLRTCRRAARTLGVTILCPTLVPLPLGAINACDRADCVERGAFVLQIYFTGPPGYVGIPWENGANHLFLLQAKKGREQRLPFLTCEEPEMTGTATVRGRSGRWMDCPEGSSMNSGHVMLIWTDSVARYVVSLHSDTKVNRSIALAVADHLEAIAGRAGR